MNATLSLEPRKKLSYRETKYFLNTVIVNWKPKSEVWHFNYGGNIAAVMSVLSSSYIMYNVRRELKLRSFAPLTCYVPVAGLSCFLAEIVQDHSVTARALTGRSCPICISTYGAVVQMGLAVAYPLIIAPLIGFYLADRLLTYPVPPLRRAPRELLKLWWTLIQKNPRPLFASAILQGAVMMYITQEKQEFVMNYVASKSIS